MRKPLVIAMAIALATTAGCATVQTTQTTTTTTQVADVKPTGIFAADSSLALKYPQFDQIKDSDFEPAFEQGMAEELADVARITGNPDAPTFENTIIAMEKTGPTLSRAQTVFYGLKGTDTNPERDRIDMAFAPKFAAHSDKIMLNPALFKRIETIYLARNSWDSMRSKSAWLSAITTTSSAPAPN